MDYAQIFTPQTLGELFPPAITDAFFEALLGDAEDGAYDIRLVFVSGYENRLNFGFELHRRPGQCLACNLTHGLPKVFDRHPVLNVKGLAETLAKLAAWPGDAWTWSLDDTVEYSRDLHLIPLIIERA